MEMHQDDVDRSSDLFFLETPFPLRGYKQSLIVVAADRSKCEKIDISGSNIA